MNEHNYSEHNKTSVKIVNQPGKSLSPRLLYQHQTVFLYQYTNFKFLIFIGGASSWSMNWGQDDSNNQPQRKNNNTRQSQQSNPWTNSS